jgi:hypothetical protein
MMPWAWALLEGSADLAGDGEDIAQRLRAAVVERIAYHQFHHDEGRTIRFPSVVHRNYIGVVEFGCSLRLVHQPAASLGAQSRGRHDLDGDVTLQQGVTGAIDDDHPTPAEFGVKAVAFVQNRADHLRASCTVRSTVFVVRCAGLAVRRGLADG